jgi:hypothetical protein
VKHDRVTVTRVGRLWLSYENVRSAAGYFCELVGRLLAPQLVSFRLWETLVEPAEAARQANREELIEELIMRKAGKTRAGNAGLWSAAAAAIMALMGLPVQAASVSFVLDQSNAESAFPDGTPYLQVMIADGTAGAIDFTVSILGPVLNVAGPNFGLQSFGFNTTGAADAVTAANITALPAGWNVSINKGQDGFGKFEFVVGDAPGGGIVRITPTLTFSITGINGDTIYDYVALSTGTVTQGHVYFAGHVAGFAGVNTLLPPSTFFGGSSDPAQVVPVPAAAWMLLSGLGVLGGVRARAARQVLR